ncbi:MAG: HAMP domain-containing histidine kinase [Firmicutes bacterium]|nr:HAMP domain-containing histidine kinase [Bacillota bacterium]
MSFSLHRRQLLPWIAAAHLAFTHSSDPREARRLARLIGLHAAAWLDGHVAAGASMEPRPDDVAAVLLSCAEGFGFDAAPLAVRPEAVRARVGVPRSRVQSPWFEAGARVLASMVGGFAARRFGYAKVALERLETAGPWVDHMCCVFLEETPAAAAVPGWTFRPDRLPEHADILRSLEEALRLVSPREAETFLEPAPSVREDVLHVAGLGAALLEGDGRPVWLAGHARRLLSALGDPAPHLAALAQETLRKGGPHSTVWESDHTQPRLWVRACAVPYGRGVLASFEDCTRERALQQALADIERVRVIGELAAAAAHDLRNPLTAVRGMVELEAREGRLGEAADFILKELDRAAAMLGDLMTIAGTSNPRVGPVSVRQVFAQVRRLVAPTCAKSRVELVMRPADATILADRAYLVRVLLNLASNALDAMGPGGRLVIAAEPAADRVLLRVTDNGPGIPEEIRKQIFHHIVTTKPTGTGLGLYNCKRFVERMGGTIEFRTRSGHGTTFTLSFPKAPAAAPEAAPDAGVPEAAADPNGPDPLPDDYGLFFLL